MALVAVVATVGLGTTGAVAAEKKVETKAKSAVTTVTVSVGDTAGVDGEMTMTVSPETVPAGKVKFVVTNEGTILHEFVVLKLKGSTTFDELAVNPKTDEVSESTNVGEIGNLPKGKTKSKTLKLKAGNYALVCNIAKHYALGMRAGLTVTAKEPTPVTTVDVAVGDTAGVDGPMTMTVSPETAPAGKVKFVVTNEGTILHEFVVLKLKGSTTFDELAVNPKTDEVSESTNVGEIGNLPKGKTKSKTLKLKAGNYALVCNIAKHYGLGMRSAFTVT